MCDPGDSQNYPSTSTARQFATELALCNKREAKPETAFGLYSTLGDNQPT